MGLSTPWGMGLTALQPHSSFRSGVPSSVSASHSQVTPSFKPHKELTRGAFPTCSPATRGGITRGKSRQGQKPLTPGEGEMALQVCRVEKREKQGLQDNWHSMPLSHIKQWGVIQRKSLIHCVTPWLPAGGTPHSSQGCHNSSRSQNPCSSAKSPYKSVFISTLVLHLQDSSEKKPPHKQCLCSPSPPLRFFTSPHSSAWSYYFSSSRHVCSEKHCFQQGRHRL